VSPVNNDDSLGVANSGPGRPLTRKEIRAREKSLATQSQSVIPPQAFETTEQTDVQPAAGATPAREAAAAAPAIPDAGPTVHDAVREEPVYEEPDREQPAYEEPARDQHVYNGQTSEQPVLEEPHPAGPVHEYAGGLSREETLRRANELQYGSEVRDGTGHEASYAGHEAYREEGSHPGYDDDPGHPLMAGAASIPTAKGRSKKVRRRRRFLALVLTLAVFVVAVVVAAQFIKPLLGGDAVADYPGPGTGEVTVTVAPGAGPKSVGADLQSKKVIANADSFVKEFAASGGALSPGTFTMRQEMKNSDAVNVLLNKGQGKIMYFALSAGMRVNESLQAISEGSGVSLTELKALSDSPAQFGLPAKAKNLEGFLFPGEYRFPVDTSAKEVLAKLVGSTLNELKSQGVTDPAKQYDALTVASIVQAEGGQAEYGDVAGAIYNRLKPNNTETNGLIQSDATVTYGLGIRSFNIDEKQKADKSNPYNTYANVGLPAGPIGSPGKTAIDAAAKPKTNDYLYWVTINLDTKETKFSKTLAEHIGYVAQYNAWCSANPGRCV